MSESKLPDFFNFKEDRRDAGYETIQEFFLAWTLRCSAEDTKNVNKKLFEYAKFMVYYLLYGKNEADKGGECSSYHLSPKPGDNFSIQSVKTFRQWNYIDLIAEIEIKIDGNIKKHILNIENKYYTRIREGQLEEAKRKTEEYYNGVDIEHLVIFCDNELLDDSTKAHCKECGYKLLSILDIITYTDMDEKKTTGNALFDEYWFNFNIYQCQE